MTQNTHSKFHNAVLSRFLIGAICIVANVCRAQEVLPPILDEEETLSNENFELLTRGPLHEAFATSAPLEPRQI